MFYELRQYKILPGKMQAWLQLMQQEIVPYQTSLGMVITGLYHGEEDDSIFVWTRRFESEAERERLYKVVYESSRWKDDIAPKIVALMDRSAIQVTRLVPAPGSPAQ